MHLVAQVYAATWFQTKVAVKYLTKEGGEAEKEFLNEIKVTLLRSGPSLLFAAGFELLIKFYVKNSVATCCFLSAAPV